MINIFTLLKKATPISWTCALILSLTSLASAQPTGLLYDPEPPVDSAYVRVLLPSEGGKMSVHVDGKVRVAILDANQVSDYLVLPLGKHVVELRSIAKPQVTLSTSLDVIRGRAITLAFMATQSKAEPIVFEDKTGTNKLKSMLSVYQLASSKQVVDIVSADGTTKVFTGLNFGTLNAVQVNPISIELIAIKTGEEKPFARASLAMTQGSAYSVFLLTKTGGGTFAQVVQNKTERYTGK